MKKKRYGIQIDDTGDLAVGTSIETGDTLAQNEYILMLAQPGELKENPLVGAGMADMVGSAGTADIKRRVRDAFKADGLQIKEFEMGRNGAIVRLEADYR
ncbi:MAG: hypothetical protein VZQ98_12320 [Bacteroidales bacterium]|nr:hypothetical protein [Bacteroidales bacterium]